MAQLRSWIEATTTMFLELERDSGSEDADVLVPRIVAVSKKVSEVYVQLYGDGKIAHILRDDANGRIQTLEKLMGENPARYGGSVHDMVQQEIAHVSGDTSHLRFGTGTYEMLWTIRIMRFLGRMFDLLIEGKDIGQAARWTYGEVIGPYHGFALNVVARLALSLAPYRATLLAQNHVSEEEAVVLMRGLAEAVRPVAARLMRYYTSHNIDFPDKV